MYRFDPNAYPDRLAFDAYARQLRAREFDRLVLAARAWLSSLRLSWGHAVAPSPSHVSPR